MLIADIVRRNADVYADRDAVVAPGGTGRSWAELEVRTNRLARAILRLGLTKGDRLAMFAPNCAEYIEFYFACAKTGVLAVAMNTRLHPDEAAAYLRYVEPAAALVHADVAGAVPPRAEVPSIRHLVGFGGGHGLELDLEAILAAEDDTDPGCHVDEDDVYVLAATSGTSGTSKAAMVTHRNAISAMANWLAEQPTPTESTFLQNSPMFFGPGGPAVLHPVLMKGGRSVVVPAFDPAQFLRLVEQYRVTHSILVPTMILMILEQPGCGTADLSSLRAINVGASPVSRELLVRARQVFGDVWYPTFGLTETSSSGLVLRPEDQHTEGTEAQVRRLGSLGKPHVLNRVRVVGDDGRDVPRDNTTVGEIWIAGPTVSPGYFRLPEESAVAREGEWFKTGDLATVDDDGFVTIVDRRKDVIVTGGINVYSREVEEAVATHPAVARVAVIGVPDDRWGEAVHAVVVPRPGAQVSPEEIVAHAAARLASYKKPRSVEVVDQLPIGATGKVLKRELRARYWEGRATKV